MEREDIGKNLRRLRNEKGLTQDKMAESAGISRVAYRNLESGHSLPRASTLEALALTLEVKLVDLLSPARELKHVRFRAAKRMNSREDIVNQVAKWLDNYRYLEALLDQSPDHPLANFSSLLSEKLHGEERAKHAARLARERLGLNQKDPIRDLAGLLEDNGIKVYRLILQSDQFFGLSVSKLDHGPAVAVNVWDRISVEGWIFSAAHELGHLLLHLDAYDIDQTHEDKDQEKEANCFASHFLMPEESFQSEWQGAYGLDLVDRVMKVKHIFQVSYSTVLYRIYEKQGPRIWPRFHQSFQRKTKKSLRGFHEPNALHPSSFHGDPEKLRANEPDYISSLYFVEDRLARLVRMAVEAEKISLSRAADILGHDLAQMRAIASSWV